MLNYIHDFRWFLRPSDLIISISENTPDSWYFIAFQFVFYGDLFTFPLSIN